MPTLRDLPAIETLMQSDSIAPLTKVHGAQVIKDRLRDLQNAMRQTRNVPDWAADPSGYSQELERTLVKTDFVPVFNLTPAQSSTRIWVAPSSAKNCGET